MSDLATLSAAASKAQSELRAEQEKQAAIAKADADERTARSIEWSWQTILVYSGELAAARDKVATALASFRAAVAQDLNASVAAYFRVAAAMGAANRLGEDLARARGILRTAGKLPPGRANRPEDTGFNAPFSFAGIPPALPSFLDMLGSELDAARSAAIRVPSTEDPSAFGGKATEAMRRAVLADEYHGDEELDLLLARKVKHPTHFAERLSAEQRALVEVYALARDASGHGDDPLPTPSIPTEWRQPSGFPTAREEAERRGRMG